MTTLSRVFPGVEVIVDRLVPVYENNRGVVSTADATERAPRQMHVVMNKQRGICESSPSPSHPTAATSARVST